MMFLFSSSLIKCAVGAEPAIVAITGLASLCAEVWFTMPICHARVSVLRSAKNVLAYLDGGGAAIMCHLRIQEMIPDVRVGNCSHRNLRSVGQDAMRAGKIVRGTCAANANVIDQGNVHPAA